MELGQTEDLEQLLLGGADPLFCDFLGGVPQGRATETQHRRRHRTRPQLAASAAWMLRTPQIASCARFKQSLALEPPTRHNALLVARDCFRRTCRCSRTDAHGPRITRHQVFARASDGGGAVADRA